MKLDEAYAAARMAARDGLLREESGATGRCTELELQARVYGGDFGVQWRGEDGEVIEIVHFGTWNREPGPDFCGARVIIDGEVLEGDIEIDGTARDWEAHGHSQSGAYKSIVLHVFFRKGARRFFTRTLENKAVPQICLEMRKASRVSRVPGTGEGLGEPEALALIEAAAQFRLKRKCSGFQRAVALCGWESAIFQAIAMGMGYKNNKIPFLLVAQRAGLDRAREKDGEALLFGLAGFLRAEYFDRGALENRGYLRELWEAWWRVQGRESRLVLPGEAWNFSALRPANHPHRRMGALAEIVRTFPRIAGAVRAGSVGQFGESLDAIDHPFWRRHMSLARDVMPREAALIGGDRKLDLTINAMLPAIPFEDAWQKLKTVGAPTPSRKVLAAAKWLCPAPRTPLHRTAWQQQGLLQLHEDFFPESPQAAWEALKSRRDAGKSCR